MLITRKGDLGVKEKEENYRAGGGEFRNEYVAFKFYFYKFSSKNALEEWGNGGSKYSSFLTFGFGWWRLSRGRRGCRCGGGRWRMIEMRGVVFFRCPGPGLLAASEREREVVCLNGGGRGARAVSSFLFSYDE